MQQVMRVANDALCRDHFSSDLLAVSHPGAVMKKGKLDLQLPLYSPQG